MLDINMEDTKQKRKSKIFSISLRESEMEQVQKFLGDFKSKTGFTLSRNEFIRKAVISHIHFYKHGGD